MGRIGTHWITDRLPTETDADPDGDVVTADSGYTRWEEVLGWQTWCQSNYWKPQVDEQASSEERDLAAFRDWLRSGVQTRIQSLPFDVRDRVCEMLQIAWANAALNARKQTAPATSTPRRFVSINRTYHDLGQTIDAIADDGTAWWMLVSQGQWIQLPPLPAGEG